MAFIEKEGERAMVSESEEGSPLPNYLLMIVKTTTTTTATAVSTPMS